MVVAGASDSVIDPGDARTLVHKPHARGNLDDVIKAVLTRNSKNGGNVTSVNDVAENFSTVITMPLDHGHRVE
jgi:hypothetical protein